MILFAIISIFAYVNYNYIEGITYCRGTNDDKIKVFEEMCEIKLPLACTVNKFVLLKRLAAKDSFLYSKITMKKEDINTMLPEINYKKLTEIKDEGLYDHGNSIIEIEYVDDNTYSNRFYENDIWKNEEKLLIRYLINFNKNNLRMYVTDDKNGEIVVYTAIPIFNDKLISLEEKHQFRKWF